MHPYGTDSNERFFVLAGIIPLSFWLAAVGRWLLERGDLSWPAEAEFFGDPASAAFAYAVLYYVFNRWLWRLGWLRRAGVVTIPDLNGRWEGHLRSSFDAFELDHPIRLDIEQSWTRIVVRLTARQSTSHSETASMMVNAGTGPTLSYIYLNRPKNSQDEALRMHQGTAVLVLRRDGDEHRLEGEYYSSRGRTNHGEMTVTRRQ